MSNTPTSKAPVDDGRGLATASMVLGICTIVPFAGIICAILAVIFGHISSSRTRALGLRRWGQATAGIVLGWIGVGFLIMWILIFFVALASSSTPGGGS